MSSKVVLKSDGMLVLWHKCEKALADLQALKDSWPTDFWSSRVGKPLWVWKYGVPLKVVPKTQDEAKALYHYQVGTYWTSNETVVNRYERGVYWLNRDIRILKDMKLLIDTSNLDGEVHLSESDVRYLNDVLDLDKTRKRLCDLREQ